MKIWIKAILSTIVLVWLIHFVTFSGFMSKLMNASWTSLFWVWFIQTTLVLVQTERWRTIANKLGIDIGFAPSLQNVWIGQFFNQVFPSAMGGDAVRAWRLHSWDIPLQPAIASIALERIVAVLAVPLIAMLGIAVFLEIVPPGALRMALVVLVLGFATGLVVLLSFDSLPLPHALSKLKITQFFRNLADYARRVFGSVPCISKATLLSIVIHAGIGLSFWFLARGLGSTQGAIPDFIVLAPLVILVTILPISIGGWGVREGAMITAMSLLGIPASTALAISVEFGLVMIAVGLPGGLVWLLDADSPRRAVTLSS